MNFLLELSKQLTSLLLFIFIFNWNELEHIGNLRFLIASLLIIMGVVVQYISYMNHKEKKLI